MNQTLEEMKRLAELHRDEPSFLPATHELATNCLRLVKALEKCRELLHEANYAIADELGGPVEDNAKAFNADDDQELTKILEGKDE